MHKVSQGIFYVRPDKIVWSTVPAPKSGFSGTRNPFNQLNKVSQDKLRFSKASINNLRNSISWFAAQAKDKTTYCKIECKHFKFKLNFITLTLASKQIHSDQEIKSQLLNQFLIELRQNFKVRNYIWRAESQENGNIHFHITTDTYIHWKFIRQNWNRIQNKLGYIDRFEKKHKHRDPNSTDIHSVKKFKNIAAYLTKYLTKSDKYRNIEGKQFGTSQTLSRIPPIKCYEGEETYEELYDTVTSQPIYKVYCDYCTLYYADWDQSFKRDTATISEVYRSYIADIGSSP